MKKRIQSVSETTVTSSVSSVTATTSTAITAPLSHEDLTGHAMNIARQRVLTFFSDEIERYVIGDLIRLSEIRPDEQTGLRGCTVPQAMLVFAILDLLGLLIRADPQAMAKKAQTAKNYKALFSPELGLFPIQYEKECSRIVVLFRLGIVHQFFPKASAIAKLGKDMPLISSEGTPCLNVDRLSEDIINAIQGLRQRIASGNHDDLAEQINSRLNELAKGDFGARRKYC